MGIEVKAGRSALARAQPTGLVALQQSGGVVRHTKTLGEIMQRLGGLADSVFSGGGRILTSNTQVTVFRVH